MSNIKHTPGPWSVHKSDGSQFLNLKDSVSIVSKHLTIATMQEYKPEKGEEQYINEMSEANAKLIAAAPDLLKAVKTALRELNKWRETFPEDEDLPGIIDELYEALDKTRL